MHRALFLLLALLPLIASAQPVRVTRIIDGRTIEVTGQKRVRLIGLDLPESCGGENDARDGARFGANEAGLPVVRELSSRHLAGLALDRSVVLDLERANAGRGHLDACGHQLAYVWRVDVEGNRLFMLNERVIADGFAGIDDRIASTYGGAFRQRSEEARQAGRGLWLHEAFLTARRELAAAGPEALPSTLVDPIVYVSRSGTLYHRKDCDYIAGAPVPMPLSEAKASFYPCTRCRPPRR